VESVGKRKTRKLESLAAKRTSGKSLPTRKKLGGSKDQRNRGGTRSSRNACIRTIAHLRNGQRKVEKGSNRKVGECTGALPQNLRKGVWFDLIRFFKVREKKKRGEFH